MRRFLAEWYRHEAEAGLTFVTEGGLQAGAAAVSASGAPIRLELALTLPTDDYAFCVFMAESVDIVWRLCLDAGAPPDRISEAERWPCNPA